MIDSRHVKDNKIPFSVYIIKAEIDDLQELMTKQYFVKNFKLHLSFLLKT